MGGPGPSLGEIFRPVLAAYQEPHRQYHNLRHISQCLDELDAMQPALNDKAAVHAAILFHDCVYDPRRGDNEERSAEVAEDVMRQSGWRAAFMESVRRLILATKHDGHPESRDAATVVDIDLSILGKPPVQFDNYERAIRREYAHVSDGDFADGRAKVLRKFLDRPAIYHSPPFHSTYEKQARENLLRSIARLEQGKFPR